MIFFIFLFFCSGYHAEASNNSEPIVDTSLGKLRGSLQRSITGDDYLAFKGIPYAKPPLGQLRFQDPLPAEAWNDIKDALKEGPVCAQHNSATNINVGSDDCLHLNVFTKNLKPNKKKPVMVWIHGGGFVEGTGNGVGPDYFMQKDVVLVVINYRLGIFGFLNLEDETAPGNQGLKDQVMALKWIRDNIVNFGGDPENVTIFGESAGGASVHYLCISPLAEGLFHKAISQSGVALNPWAKVADPKKFAYKMSQLLGNDILDHKKIVEFLRTIDPLKLIETQNRLLTKYEKIQFMFAFGPGVDAKSENPFLPVDPEIAAEKGVQVPLLIGSNSREGIFLMEIAQEHMQELLPISKSKFGKFVHPNIRKLIKSYNLVPDDLRRLYFNNDNLTEENFYNLTDLMGDMHFIEGIQKVVKIQVEKSSSPTYLYQYSYGKFMSSFKRKSNLKGANHGDELWHLFRWPASESTTEPLKKGSNSYKIMQQMIELWVNFATTGRPTPAITELVPFYWKPVTSGTVLRFIKINEDLRMDVSLNLGERLSAHEFRKNVKYS